MVGVSLSVFLALLIAFNHAAGGGDAQSDAPVETNPPPGVGSGFSLLFCDQNCAFCEEQEFGSCQPSKAAGDATFLRGVNLTCSENSSNNTARWQECTNASCNEGCKDVKYAFETEAFCDSAHGISFICPDAHCFPGRALLERQDGSYARMDQVQLGEVVRVSKSEFSAIYLWGHFDLDATAYPMKHVQFANQSALPLDLSMDHLVFLLQQDTHAEILLPASKIRTGDWMQHGSGNWALVHDASTFITMTKSEGKFAPHTLHGNIVVNNFVVSSYTCLLQPQVAHSLLLGIRVAWKYASIVKRKEGGYFLHSFTPAVLRRFAVSYWMTE